MWAAFKALTIGKKLVVGIVSFLAFSTVAGAVAGTPPSNPPNEPQPEQIQQIEPVIETKNETITEKVAFETKTEDDPTLESGTEKTTTDGVEGEKEIVYEVTYTDGLETDRRVVSESITSEPVSRVIKRGTKTVSTYSAPSPGSGSCDGYINTYGNCVASPSSDPAGASAKCRDGTYSYSQSRSGTCSHHGGVGQWL